MGLEVSNEKAKFRYKNAESDFKSDFCNAEI